METRIGESLKTTPRILWALVVIGLIVISLDMTLVITGHGRWLYHYRITLALIVSLVYGFAQAQFQPHESALGFRLSPRQGWIYWAKMAAVVGLVIAAILAVLSFIGLGILGYEIPKTHLIVTKHTRLADLFVWMCIVGPAFEEVLYRLALCAPAAAVIGARSTVIVGGLIFAGLHVLYGAPSPENLLGGFILTWAFLKSETLIVPIVLHSLGNFGAFSIQVALFYFWQS